ncbi:hypothetical protein QBC47DRAFT_460795 [Echria macrotheca]|uniref:Peptidase M20 domain-containing protein 2 n=1 Tax=Echria macrotheca TaxID=438768 RepID=A0AAJ0BFH5_9PEZI|nr:hypothetical protein QBC47DRAFT_460795 [Echria macrotheca]
MDTEEDGFVIINHHGPSSPDPDTPTHLRSISQFIDAIADELWPVNKTIHDNPELGYEEHHAHDVLTAFLESRPGWTVTRSAYGLQTAWIAVFASPCHTSGPVVSFNVEMDALPDIGHACGHNLIATASLAAALAAAHTLQTHPAIPGKIVLLGTPAEEGGGGKKALLRAGAYAAYKTDISLISHPGIVPNAALVRTSAYARLRVRYTGRASHAAASPWLGINALDALVVAYTAISALRQQTMSSDIIQGTIAHGGGDTPNIIPARAEGVFIVRAGTQARLRELEDKVRACFEAGATATGARLDVTSEQAYADHVPNRALARSYTRYFNRLGPSNEKIPADQDVDEMRGRTGASTDQGDVSYAMPSLSPGFAILPGPLGTGPHSPEFAESAGTRDAFDRTLRVGKALAGTAVDVLTQKGLLDEVKREWREATAGQA